MDTNKTTIGDRIRQRRKELNLTQDELAKRMGYSSRTAISNVEKGGEDLTSTRIQKYADALECSPAYLMGWEDAPSASFFFTTRNKEGNKVSTSILPIPETFETTDKSRFIAYFSYITRNEHARNLLEEAFKCSDEDIDLATKFLTRLNKSNDEKKED